MKMELESSGAGLCHGGGPRPEALPAAVGPALCCLLTYTPGCWLSLSRFKGPLPHLELFLPVHGSIGCFILSFSHPTFTKHMTSLHFLTAPEELWLTAIGMDVGHPPSETVIFVAFLL